ncbi:hypothetical protein MASR2M70_10170 [Bacillota bacterium]
MQPPAEIGNEYQPVLYSIVGPIGIHFPKKAGYNVILSPAKNLDLKRVPDSPELFFKLSFFVSDGDFR